jgi:hypothetical protein
VAEQEPHAVGIAVAAYADDGTVVERYVKDGAWSGKLEGHLQAA